MARQHPHGANNTDAADATPALVAPRPLRESNWGCCGATFAGWPACWPLDTPPLNRTVGDRRYAARVETNVRIDNTFGVLWCSSSFPPCKAGRIRQSTPVRRAHSGTVTPSTSQRARRKKMIDSNQEEAKKTTLSHRPTNASFIPAVTVQRPTTQLVQASLAKKHRWERITYPSLKKKPMPKRLS